MQIVREQVDVRRRVLEAIRDCWRDSPGDLRWLHVSPGKIREWAERGFGADPLAAARRMFADLAPEWRCSGFAADAYGNGSLSILFVAEHAADVNAFVKWDGVPLYASAEVMTKEEYREGYTELKFLRGDDWMEQD